MIERIAPYVHGPSAVVFIFSIAGAVYSGFGSLYASSVAEGEPLRGAELHNTFDGPFEWLTAIAVVSAALAYITRPK